MKWSQNGMPYSNLMSHGKHARDDMDIALYSFACLTNIKKAIIRLPPTLQHNDEVTRYASRAIRRMEGGFLAPDLLVAEHPTDPYANDRSKYLEQWLTGLTLSKTSDERHPVTLPRQISDSSS